MRDDEAKSLLLACMTRLPDHDRQVLQLRFLEERPVAEVARIVGYRRLPACMGNDTSVPARCLRYKRTQALEQLHDAMT